MTIGFYDTDYHDKRLSYTYIDFHDNVVRHHKTESARTPPKVIDVEITQYLL